MKFSNPRQMTAIALCWAGILFGYDYHKNPRTPREYWREFVSGHAEPTLQAAYSQPHLTLTMNHLCCSGCLSDVRTALEPLHWLGKATVREAIASQESADLSADSVASNANRLEVDITDISQADFVALDRALRDEGLVAERMDLSGIPHFQLEAEVKHLCCTVCSTSLLHIADLLRAYHQSWVKDVTVKKNDRKIVASVRYNTVVDVMGFVAGLNALGFAPSAIRVVFEI